jgi:hypothetical protein
MPWVESASDSFTARHDLEDADDAARVLGQLESTREHLASRFAELPEEIAVVLHGSDLQLGLAHPYLPFVRRLTAPAGRRYLVGWFGRREVHVLAPRLLAARASNVPGSLETLMLAPAALYAQLVVGGVSPALPPPFRPRSLAGYLRWAWMAQGIGQLLSGQTAHLRPAIARRLREGSEPRFPPGLRDAALLGGTVLDLLAREEGEAAAVELAARAHPEGAEHALAGAFGGRSLRHTEQAWRAHLERMAEP